MSPVIVGVIGLVALFTLLAFGLPIGVGMALVGFGGLWYLISQGAAIVKLGIIPFEVMTNWGLATLPLFLLMAHVVFAAGFSRDLYDVAAKWLGHQRGGIAMATVGGCRVCCDKRLQSSHSSHHGSGGFARNEKV
jgi:C4-dicarboxylate transporter DctM subunit